MNISDWLCSIGLTAKQVDQSQTPSPSSPSSKHTGYSITNSEMPHLDYIPIIINQCLPISPVLLDQNSPPAMRKNGSSECSSPLKMNGTKSEVNKSFMPPPSISLSGMKITHSSYPPSTQKYTNEYLKTTHSENTTLNHGAPNGTRSWRTTPTSAKGSLTGGMENHDYASILQLLKKQNWQENITMQKEKNDTDSAACATSWNLIVPRNENVNRSNSSSNNSTRSWTKSDVAWKQQPEEGVMLRSAVTMPTKNFFPSSLTPTHSSHYPFLYTTYKCPLSRYSTSMSLNCQTPNYPPSSDSTSTSLNCNLTQTPHDMPSGLDGGLSHLGHLGHLSQWLNNMPSGCTDSLDPFGHLSHLGHLGYLGLLGHLGYLNVLDPEPIDLPLHMFI
jgi:hypothetical protein